MGGGSVFAGAAYGFGLPASEGYFVYEIFAPGRATGFPRHEDMGGDEAADGRGGVAQEGCGLVHSDTLGGFKLYRSFHALILAQRKRECRMFFKKSAFFLVNNNAHNAHARA